MQRVFWLFCVLAAFAAPGTHAQTLLATTLTLGKKPDAIERPLTLAAGSYRLTITDFGAPAPRLARADVGVTLGSTLVTSGAVLVANAAGVTTKNFTAAAGEHRVIVIGQPNSPAKVGSVAVRIDDPVSGAILFDELFAFAIPDPPAASPATFERDLSVAAGAYTFESTDFTLPQALGVLQTTVIRQRDLQVLYNAPGPAVVQLVSSVPEVYEVIVYAELASGVLHGLLGLNLRNTATGANLLAEVNEIGEWPSKYAFDLPDAATVTATLTDLQFPFGLTALGAVIARDGLLVTPNLTGSASGTFAASAGAYTAYVDATPAATGPGTFGLLVRNDVSGARLVEAVQSVLAPAAATDVTAVERSFEIQAAGNYTLTLTDFGVAGFFDAFTSVSLALTRDSAIVGSPLDAPGDLTFAATPGRYQLAILADPAGASGEGLLAVRVRGGPGNAVVYEDTAAVGTDFISATFDVASTSQNVDAELVDLGFPADFDEIKVAVTRGAERVGEIVGKGRIPLRPATPGKYFVNLLATPDAVLGYSTLGVNVRVPPAQPTVTLAAGATSITAGGNTTLTWSSTNATTCAASGAWTGARPTSGTAPVGPLSANSSFTLTCTGPGGSDDETVNVTITAEQRSGGGGGADWAMLLLLGLGAASARRAQPRPRNAD